MDTDSSLDVPLSLYRNALAARPVGHSDRPSTLILLAAVHFARFEKRRDVMEGVRIEALVHEAMELSATESHEKRAATFLLQLHGGRGVGHVQADGDSSVEQDSVSRLTDEDPGIFSVQLLDRFERFGDVADLQHAITLLEGIVRSTSVWDRRYCGALGTLGAALSYRFGQLGEVRDLEEAISRHREAVDLTPHGHPDRLLFLNNLGGSIFTRFERLGEPIDLEHAISMLRVVVDLTPHGHPNTPGRLTNLGNSFKARFERHGDLSDLEDAISRQRAAVDLTPRGHPGRPNSLNNLGHSLITRFGRLGELSDLDRAISTFRDAVDLIPHGHPHKPSYLNNLGNSFFTRFQHLGELSDLEDAISSHRVAVDLTTHCHPYKPAYLDNLGSSLEGRFQRLGELSDLEDAISRKRDAVDLTPRGHLAKPRRLNSLGNSLTTRFRRLGELSDLEDAVSRHKEAVDLTPQSHPDKPRSLNSLGNSFFNSFVRLGELSDLEDAISRYRDAVDLTPHGHPDKAAYLSNLGNSFDARFQRLGELSDLEDSIWRERDAVGLTPNGHPDKPRRLNDLGDSFVTRFEHFGELSNLEQAISLYLHAASAPIGPIGVRFQASQNWISCARRISHHSLLHAYSVAINLLPELAWIGLSLTHRYSELTLGANVVREAAAAALDSGLLETAVEWLEQGRSIVWGEHFQLRRSYEELSFAHPDHAHRLRKLSAALEHASATREKSLSTLLKQTRSTAYHVTESLQQEVDRQRTLAIERDKLLQEIRRLPGFEQFLRRTKFSQLQASAHSGPVVMLNAAENRCDALIVLADVDHVIHVPLSTFTFQRSAGLQKLLEKLLRDARVIGCDDREGKIATRGGVSWEPLLSTLWSGVVRPTLHALAFSVRHVVSLEFIPDRLQTDCWGSTAHLLVPDGPLCVSSYPCCRFL